MSGSKPGERRGGRQKGVKNRTTLEREQRALDEIRGKAAKLAPQTWGKDALEDLIPQSLEVLGAVKGIVARLQEAAYKQLEPPGALDPATWDRLKEWMTLLKDTQATASLIMSRAAEFQSPKLQRIAVGIGIGMIGESAKANPADDNVVYLDDPNAASRVYQRFIQNVA